MNKLINCHKFISLLSFFSVITKFLFIIVNYNFKFLVKNFRTLLEELLNLFIIIGMINKLLFY